MKFSPAPINGNCYQMVGFRMLAAACFDGTVLIFRVDHQDNGTTPQLAQVNQTAQTKVEAPILGMCW